MDDFLDRLFLPCECLSDFAHSETRDVELRRCRSTQVVEVQIALRKACVDLRFVERTPKTIGSPWSSLAAGEDRGRPPR